MTRPPVPPELLDVLACPVCSGPLDPVSPMTVGCFAGHRFDRSRHGYLTLLGPRSRTDTGDDAGMVAARRAFLDAGHYEPVIAAVAAAVTGDGPVLELGAGTAHYLRRVLDDNPDRFGIAVDSSKVAARAAVGAHPRLVSVVADAWAPLPIRDSGVATVLNVFAPRVLDEIGRILEPGGRLVVVTPEPDHLAELSGPLGLLRVDAGKAERLAEASTGWTLEASTLRWTMTLPRADVLHLAGMGPAARHHSAPEFAAAADGLADQVPVTAAVTVSVLGR